MKNLIKATLVIASLVIVNAVLAQGPPAVSSTSSTTVAPDKQTSTGTPTKQEGKKTKGKKTNAKASDTKGSAGDNVSESSKETDGTPKTTTRMAISEQGIPADKSKGKTTATPSTAPKSNENTTVTPK